MKAVKNQLTVNQIFANNAQLPSANSLMRCYGNIRPLHQNSTAYNLTKDSSLAGGGTISVSKESA